MKVRALYERLQRDVVEVEVELPPSIDVTDPDWQDHVVPHLIDAFDKALATNPHKASQPELVSHDVVDWELI